jgi:amino acid permease
MTTNKLISREEVLGGMSGRSTKQASTLLVLIENRTARLVAQSQAPLSFIWAEKTLKARNQAFLEALALGRETPLRPTIQDIERYASQWAALAPDDATVRAATANLLVQKYRFSHQAVPELRLALGLDSQAVQQAYQRLYSQPLSTIYAPRPTLAERWRWVWSALSRRVEAIPPFWMTLALNLPGAAGLLALPIALAQVGLATGLILLVIFGLINILTVACLAETVARSGSMRFGLGFLGQLMQEYLGQAGSVLMTVTLALNNFFVLIIFYIGVAGTLEDATRLPIEVWVAAMFGVCLYFLSRKSLNATIATTLMIIFINILVLLAIPLLALPYFQWANLAMGEVPFVNGAGVKPATLQLIFGIMLSTYFSHMQVATYGPVVLRRDPSARSWIQGSVVAILIYMLVCCFWLIVINGVIPPDTLANTAGTVLSPLAARIGPIIHLLGSWLVIFSMGLTSVQIALGLYYLVQERLPAKSAASALGRLNEQGRFWLAVSPVAAVFVLTEWVALTGFGTFTSLLNFIGVLALPLLGGMFPVLLLAATRRKGDFVPGVVYRLWGSPAVLSTVYLIFQAIIVVHGVFIWQSLPEQLGAWIVVLFVMGATLVMLRGGALSPRTVIELRQDQRQDELSLVAITSGGQPASAEIVLGYAAGEEKSETAPCEVPNFASLRYTQVHLPRTQARQLKIWTHRITPEGGSENLPGAATVHAGSQNKAIDLELSEGPVILAWPGEQGQVKIKVTGEERSRQESLAHRQG